MANRGVESPARAVRSPGPEQVPGRGLVQRMADRADVPDRLGERAVAGRRVATDGDRDLADPAAVEHGELARLEQREGLADRLHPQGDRVMGLDAAPGDS